MAPQAGRDTDWCKTAGSTRHVRRILPRRLGDTGDRPGDSGDDGLGDVEVVTLGVGGDSAGRGMNAAGHQLGDDGKLVPLEPPPGLPRRTATTAPWRHLEKCCRFSPRFPAACLPSTLLQCGPAEGRRKPSGRIRRLRVVGHRESDKLGAGGQLEPRSLPSAPFLFSSR